MLCSLQIKHVSDYTQPRNDTMNVKSPTSNEVYEEVGPVQNEYSSTPVYDLPSSYGNSATNDSWSATQPVGAGDGSASL